MSFILRWIKIIIYFLFLTILALLSSCVILKLSNQVFSVLRIVMHVHGSKIPFILSPCNTNHIFPENCWTLNLVQVNGLPSFWDCLSRTSFSWNELLPTDLKEFGTELGWICSLCSVIVRVSVVLKRTVGDSDWRFDNLSGRHLQSHCDIVPSVDGIYVSGYWPDWSIKLSCYWL